MKDSFEDWIDSKEALEQIKTHNAQDIQDIISNEYSQRKQRHDEIVAQYIRGNVVSEVLRQAITARLQDEVPNIMHLCALAAKWKKRID